ncbi:MAG: (d)CMP kinase [Rectinema sp.]|nr:(d)CMP kinase [Rectinema sp.]
MKVAIDGPAGCGKSTIARMIAESLGFLYMNSGNLYRAVALMALRHSVDWHDGERLTSFIKQLHFDYRADGAVIVNGEALSTELRTPEVDAIVAQVSAIPSVREEVNAIIRRISEGKDVVSEGRDITTVVFPDAEVKFYLDARPEVRAERRYLEHAGKLADTLPQVNGSQPAQKPSKEEVLENIKMRDAIDTGKAVGALKKAEDAEYLDTSGLTIVQVYEKVYSKILTVRNAHGRK